MRLAPGLVSYYTKILKSLSLSSRSEKTKSFLGSSPVKLLSSFWGGGSTSEQSSSPPKHQRQPVASIFPPPLPRSNSQSIFGSFRDRDSGRPGADDSGRPDNPLMRLEQTFTGYVASLQSRKGSIEGRALLNRSSADELSVNDLYNRLIESPYDVDYSSELGAEVIFVAFEKFIRIAWREQMGPIISIQALDTLQERANKRVPGDFADFVNFLFGDMAPQNRRGFTAVIKLLADLLDGCGNDGDRGALTLAFAELLVPDDSAHNYINLLDRLVEDCDRIFEEAGFGASMNLGGSGYDSMNSAHRSTKSHTGSVTSNTSSLRRKFGFDNLLRQNSSDRPSVWRSLSKHSRNPATGDVSLSSSLSKASVNRSRSIDMTNAPPGPNKLRRPGSRDRPPVAGAFDELQRPASSHRMEYESRLETIGEPDNEGAAAKAKTPKAKRRSSLSDLKSLMAAASLEDPPLMPLRINKQLSEKFNSTPRIPAPSKIPISPQSSGLLSQSLRSPRQKENIGDPFSGTSSQTETTSSKTHSKTLSTSNIPTLKPSRSAGTSGGSESPTRPTSSPTKSSGGKLRLQSPQKLRERLQTEKQAVDEVDASLRSELSKIAEDMARVNSGLGARSNTVDLRKVAASVRALEERVPQAMRELAERQSAVQAEVEAALRASEVKVKAIDQLYKEATAENELLYEKFNTELGKIVKALKGKGREDKEELVARLREMSEETARAKKENGRLRREMASLRAALKGGD